MLGRFRSLLLLSFSLASLLPAASSGDPGSWSSFSVNGTKPQIATASASTNRSPILLKSGTFEGTSWEVFLKNSSNNPCLIISFGRHGSEFCGPLSPITLTTAASPSKRSSFTLIVAVAPHFLRALHLNFAERPDRTLPLLKVAEPSPRTPRLRYAVLTVHGEPCIRRYTVFRKGGAQPVSSRLFTCP
jgi:hypothetical protein